MSLVVCDHSRSTASKAFLSCSTLTDRAQAVAHDSPARTTPRTHTDRRISPPYLPSGSLSLFGAQSYTMRRHDSAGNLSGDSEHRNRDGHAGIQLLLDAERRPRPRDRRVGWRNPLVRPARPGP